VSITRLAITRNRVTTAALVIVALAGVQAYFRLPRAEDPGFLIRTAQVTASFPGASPQRVEELVTDKLEEAIQEMAEIDFLSSESQTGLSVIYVNLLPRYKDLQPIWDDLRRKVERVQRDLPAGVVPVVNDEFGDVFGTVLAVRGEGFSYAELKDIADEARDDLLLLDDVAKVLLLGVQDERVFIEYHDARLAELGLSTLQLEQLLSSRNIITPGGKVYTSDEAIVLEPSGNFNSVEDIRRAVITLPDGQDLVYLQDIADVRRDYVDPPTSVVRATGAPAIGLAISMRDGGNILTLGEEVRLLLAEFEGRYPHGLEFDIIAFQSDAVDHKVSAFVMNVIQAIGIVILVMLITLGVRTGLIVSSLIPMAMLMALLIMSFLGIGLDQMSLAALIIALGMLVDNAIVMTESIMVQIGQGKDRLQAAIDSARELRIPLLTSSMTTAAAFLPIYLAKSNTGEYTAPLFKVVTITLMSSWILSLTMIPALSYRFLRVPATPPQPYQTPFYRRYRQGLTFALRHRALSLGLTLGAFLGVMRLAGLVPNIFFPAGERPTATATIFTAPGSPISHTQEALDSLEKFMRDSMMAGPGQDGLVSWATFIGRGGPRFLLSYAPEPPNPEHAYLIINATSRGIVDSVVARLRRFTFAHFPGMTARFDPVPLGPPVGWPIQVRLTARDPDRLFAAVEEVKTRLRDIPGVRQVNDDWGRRTKKIMVHVNEARARRAGVSSQDVAVSLQTIMSGFTTTEYREGTKIIPVTLRSVAADRGDLGKIESMNVYAQASGRAVPLKQVADLEIVWQPSRIKRRDRLWTVTVRTDLVPGLTAAEVIGDLRPWLDDQQSAWGRSVVYGIGGTVEEAAKGNASIGEQLPIAALIIVFLLIGQFNSFRKPTIILLTIPMGMIGVILGLIIARSFFGFVTLLGIIALAGIVINNAIVLLDRIQIELDIHGRSPQDAIIEAAQRRLRPILLTTLTTIGGLIPLWIGGGPMFEPMAITIIFGLGFSTMLTLGLVPVLYSLFYRVTFAGYKNQLPGAEA